MIDFTDAEPGSLITLAGSPDEGFTTLYGTPATHLGEGECLLALGHISDRMVRAVTLAYHRRIYGHRILPGTDLTNMTRTGTQHIWIRAMRCDEGHDFTWEFEEAVPSAPDAQPATTIDVELLRYEDDAIPVECPSCDRISRSTSLTTGPGRAGWGHYHRCRNCDHQWPAIPVLRLTLTKRRQQPITRSDNCFACACLPGYPCTGLCTIQPEPLIGQRLCSRCRAQH
ncbi:hypothetical protein, partial [Streptomyces mirabilis]